MSTTEGDWVCSRRRHSLCRSTGASTSTASTATKWSQTSLGYFINPLVSVLFGVVLLHERLRRAQWSAVSLGGVAVSCCPSTMAIFRGSPWCLPSALVRMGCSRRSSTWDALESLTVETAADSRRRGWLSACILLRALAECPHRRMTRR